MKKLLFLICFYALSLSLFAQSKQDLSLVPIPAKIKKLSGEFIINRNTQIILSENSDSMRNAVATFNSLLRRSAGYALKVTTDPVSVNVIDCKISSSVTNPEGYMLKVKKNRISIEAQTSQGIFYGMQTLRQLLPMQIERPFLSDVDWTVPCVEIEDEPRFQHRGLMLDVCRHFQSKEFVMKFIDMLAYHKMNVFHWHLTDDQGWRISIDKYPKLTQVGAFRPRSLILIREDDGKITRTWENQRYGNYYTKEDIKQVIAYAEKKFVTIIPEVEFPGHATAALAAYPELSCSGGPFEVEVKYGVFNDIFCPKDKTFEFMEDVLSEVADLFPGKYIHIGGDEAPKVRWKNCAHCQDLIKREGLKDEHELQSYFIKRIESFVESKGKRIIGWDEILEGGLAPNATVLSWRGEEGGIAAAQQGNDVIMAPTGYAYLDYYQANPKTQPPGIGGFVPLWKTYSYEPVPEVLTEQEAEHILGMQGNIWTEYIRNSDHAEYMAYPRGAAIAEITWSPKIKKDYDNFKSRIIEQFKRYDAMGWNYCNAILSEVK
ncbi:beta-N-acetylhexosaminidase [Bacteroidales bacterium OttesenSCG-928-M06]|nr:beta-N-acetylhexosaminidase [Bacteroidales bacterium OttesenSCG-928-M06]